MGRACPRGASGGDTARTRRPRPSPCTPRAAHPPQVGRLHRLSGFQSVPGLISRLQDLAEMVHQTSQKRAFPSQLQHVCVRVQMTALRRPGTAAMCAAVSMAAATWAGQRAARARRPARGRRRPRMVTAWA
jgi:hypothetical protein